MSIHTFAQLRHPSRVPWWTWVENAGATGLVILAVLLLAGRALHPLAIGALLHVAADFTFQSHETSVQKAKRGRHLLVHALAAGGLPLAIAAFLARSPTAVVTWTAFGVVSHYAVDWTRKFGVRRVGLSVLLDQACHVLTILVLALTS